MLLGSLQQTTQLGHLRLLTRFFKMFPLRIRPWEERAESEFHNDVVQPYPELALAPSQAYTDFIKWFEFPTLVRVLPAFNASGNVCPGARAKGIIPSHHYDMATQIHRTIHRDSTAHSGDLVRTLAGRVVYVGHPVFISCGTHDVLCGSVIVAASTTLGAIGLLLVTGHRHSQSWSQPRSDVATSSAAGCNIYSRQGQDRD